MVMKILSHARKTGVFKEIQYDKIILYGCSIRECYSSNVSSLSGHPIEFHEVPISVSKFNDIFLGWDITKLDELVGKNVSITYDIKSYAGKQKVVLSHIEIVEGV